MFKYADVPTLFDIYRLLWKTVHTYVANLALRRSFFKKSLVLRKLKVENVDLEDSFRTAHC
jgi:hypothetical protein